MLPREPGSMVWLEAPYGYGKSVLTMQWSTQLESQGWRTIWLSLRNSDPLRALCEALELQENSPWGIVIDFLWQEKTLLVLEDLDGDEVLDPLLKHVQGLILLASRQRLAYPELLKHRTDGSLVHLTSSDLAFTEQETFELLPKRQEAKQLWEKTKGWTLPIHVTALMGESSEQTTLIEGIKESLSVEAWQEALFLAALPYIPLESSNEHTQQLAKLGFVQPLELGFRLHELLAKGVRSHFFADMQLSVQQQVKRLPLALQGSAFEASELYTELDDFFSPSSEDISRYDPEAVLRWDRLLPRPRSLLRTVRVGWSYWTLGQKQKAFEYLLDAASSTELSDNEALLLYKDVVWVLASAREMSKARELAELGLKKLDAAEPEVAGRFLNNMFFIDFQSGNWEKAAESLEAALNIYPPDSPYGKIAKGNLAITRWHVKGDFESILTERAHALEVGRKLNPSNVAGDLLQLAELTFLLNNKQQALLFLEDLPRWRKASPRWALEGFALKAYLEKDAQAFKQLFIDAGHWEDSSLHDRVLFFWARTHRDLGLAAPHLLDTAQTSWCCIEQALGVAKEDLDKALALLGSKPAGTKNMELRLYWQAAHAILTQSAESLSELCALTQAKEQVLPSLIPLRDLPQDHPEFSQPYPFEEVLKSGWSEAILLRQQELPALSINLLGSFEVQLLGKTLELSNRLKQILCLMVLDTNRDEIAAAMWPEADTKKSRNNLNVQLNFLRKAIEPWGFSRYLFESGLKNVTVDLHSLENALNTNEADTLMKLYRTPFAAGIKLELVEDFRVSLKQDVIACLLEASLIAEVEKARAYLEFVLELDPSCEEGLQQLIALLLKLGRRREAKKRFAFFETFLKSELNMAPMPETEALLNV